MPKTLSEKLDKFIMYLYRNTDYVGKVFDFNEQNTFPAIAYAKDSSELYSIIEYLVDSGLLDDRGSTFDTKRVFLTHEGLNYAEELNREHPNTNQVFVARWFDDAGRMERIYKEAIWVACDICGYKANCINEKQYNGDIVDKIIGEIKASRFVIADFTGQRGGVYFEAGYADGMGLPVICIWDKTISKEKGFESEKLHFDIEHKNAIFYESIEDLKLRLIDRIRATIGDYKAK